MSSVLTPDEALAEIAPMLDGTLSFGAGSCLSARDNSRPWSDLDIFVPTEQMLIANVQSLLDHGYTIPSRYARVWQRWLRYGMRGWHTNSMKLHSRSDVETNVIYKIVDGHATTSLAQVLESFDFGLLGIGYDFESRQHRDMRPYLFPGQDPEGPLPLMPNKREAWRSGFISQYNGLREAARYAKYHNYGYDLSQVKDDLIMGYRMVSLYFSGEDYTTADKDKQLLAQIYSTLADKIGDDAIDELAQSYKVLDFKDPLEEILDALE